VSCGEIINETQCADGLVGTTLEGKCKYYNNMCQLKCSNFVGSGSCTDDCFWLYNETSGVDGSCKEKNDNLLKCENVKRKEQCTLSDVLNLGNNCFWLYNQASGVDGICKERNDNSLQCSDAQREGQCTLSDVLNLGNNCVWVNGECLSVEEKCEMITNSFVCDTDGCVKSGKCIWVEEEEPGLKCQGVKENCEVVTTEASCIHPGIAKLEETNFVCVWVEVEETRCQTVRDSCESVKTENSCNSPGIVNNKNCIWIDEELDDIKCQEIKDSCELISTEATCNYFNETKFDVLDCFWLFNRNDNNGGGCKWKNDSSLKCSDSKREDQCNFLSENKFSLIDCIWVSGMCHETKDKCEEIIVSEEICETAGVGKDKECIWVEGEDIKCQELKEACESIITEPSCTYFNTKQFDQQSFLCAWVKSEDVKCQTRHESCGTIMNRNLCESLGVSLSGECFWLEQNGSEPKQQCIEKVL
jgi:hypothetical protein